MSNSSIAETAAYIAKKAVQLVLSLIILALIVFFVSRLAPGDPLKAYYGEAVERMSSQQLAAAEQRLGLNDPLIVQFADWVAGALKGDFGISYQYKQPAQDVIGQVLGNTLLLTFTSFILIFILGLLLAIFCVKREGSAADKIICRIGVATGSIPEFFAALILIMIFASGLGILPQSGAVSISIGTGSGLMAESAAGAYNAGIYSSLSVLADRIIHLILPVSTIVITHLWYCTYMMRNKLSNEMSKEYILMLKVKGLNERQIIYRHCLKNIMPSCISIMAIFLPHLLGGAYVVELVFSYPGLGKLGVESAQYHDYNMLMLVCLITGAIVITAGIAAQIINEKLSPETKEERGQML